MRAVFTADLHVGDYPTGPFKNGVNQRIPDVINQLKRIRDYMIRNSIKHLFVLGDLFKTKQPSMLHLSVLAEILYNFRECGINVYLMTGNHDVQRIEGQSNSLSVFKYMHLHGIFIFDEPQGATIEGVQFLFFPYTGAPQDQKLKTAIQKFPNNQVLLMHGSVEGGLVSKGVDYEIHDEDEVKFDTVSGFKAVFAGHLHTCHNIGHVWYPGSVECLSFDDEGSEKKFLDVNIADQIQVTQVPLDTRKMITLTYDQMPQVISGLLDVRDAIVRIVDVEPEYFMEVQRILREKGCYHLANIQRRASDKIDIERIESTRLDVTEFVKRFAKKVKYKGDVEEASRVIIEALNN